MSDEIKFTAEDMLEFANQYAEYETEVTILDLISYLDQKKREAENEYKLYLTLKQKYEK